LVDQQQDYVLLVSGAELHGRCWPVSDPRAVVAVAHGVNEHIGRYEDVARVLNDAGYSVVGVDHRGHGRSGTAGRLTSNIRRFDTFVDDYIALIDRLGRENDRPVIALGHSMGGLIAARAALRAQDRMAALVLSGPALQIPMPMGPVMRRIAMTVARLFPFLPSPVRDMDGLSRNPDVRAMMREDPLCIQEPIRLGIGRQLYLFAEETRCRANEIQVPLLVMHGGADPITDPDGSREFVANASSADKEFILWPDDQHEIFNELDRDQVLKRLVDWLDERFPSS
jgi:alpha-beta hydrolase superfamily lysophospholipase